MAELTPMMKQYLEIKEKNPDCLLFFRLGDFYEMFNEDARIASRELDLVLTTRDRSKENPDDRTPMCGVPFHSCESYIARLIAKGYKVAICEQMEDPALAKGLVERDIIRIVTPGTLMESSMLEEGRSNYLAAVCTAGHQAAICFAELSTGEMSVTLFPGADLNHMVNELSAYMPAEAVLDEESGRNQPLGAFLKERLECLTQTMPCLFEEGTCRETLCRHFGVALPEELSPDLDESAVMAAGGLLRYMEETQKTDLSHISRLRINAGSDCMELDLQTVRSLELIASNRTQEKRGSLLWVLDHTKTAMGRRLLRSWVMRPLLSPVQITRRLSAVDELYQDAVCRGEMTEQLRRIGDMERLIGKIVYGTANGRDLRALWGSLLSLPELQRLLADKSSGMLKELKDLDLLEDIRELIDRSICEEPPFSVREAGFIRVGYDSQVDYLRGLLTNSNDALTAIETKERERTGKKLKIGYNRVFGYYIEIPRSMSEDVPEDYVRKQTLTNCERFITGELKNLETELLNARDSLADLEYRLFTEIREQLAAQVLRVQATAAKVAAMDVLCSLAETAAKNNYCRPEIDLSGILDIRDGRHPVVEVMQKDTLFVPNDTMLNRAGDRAALITGPNMAGKSTYMRQTALITLMAQIGSFVPARSAHIGIADRVFTRIGASDDLSAGMSTFMVEMTEVADILKHATASSLLILDEIGRGTSTYDGMAIAKAVLEYCADKKTLGARTMFATHYHELTAMETEGSGIRNYSITAKKKGKDVIFLRKIVPGGADDSYGIEVAGLAGVPDSVVRRAKAVLKELEEEIGVPIPPKRSGEVQENQLSFLDMGGNELAEILRSTDLNTLTPIEALNLLYTMKKKVSDEN
ncbi:MAG: DNA mismatch repair protein MutS [Oscillospiraceae bacterium]|nr:DNA mismatch repair protein MutS [Oscillospiraceae bacterium]